MYVASTAKQLITLEIPGKGYKAIKLCQANEVVEFILTPITAQPFLKAKKDQAPAEQVYSGAAIHVSSKAPIVCYGITRYRTATDGFLVIPVSALGKEYIVSSYPQYSDEGTGNQFTSETTISAAYDNTEVFFEMGGTTQSETSGGLKSGKIVSFTLARKGDVLCFSSNGDLQDLSGSRIISSKPVAVVSGNQCANIPVWVSECGYLSEMELPTFAWGKEYHIAPFYGRKKNPIIRIYARDKNTTVYRDGQEWLVIPRGTRKYDDGYVERRSFDDDPRTAVITADKPIYVEIYNPGQADDDITSNPFQMILTPFEQYQTEIIWSTPGSVISNDNFKDHYANVVYQLNLDGTIPEDIEFAVSVNGRFEWKRLSARFGHSPGFIFSVPVNAQKYACKQLKLPGDNVYRIRARTPFALYAHGYSSSGSYGMSAGIKLNNLEVKDTLKPRPTWTVDCGGSVKNGTVTDYPDDSVNNSNLGLIYMDMDSSYNYEFSYDSKKEFIAGTTRTTDWSLKVIDQGVKARAFLVFKDRAGNDTTIFVEYQDSRIIMFDSVDFGVVKSGTSRSTVFSIANYGNRPFKIQRFELKNKNQGFGTGNLLQFVIIPNSIVDLFVDFTNIPDGIYEDQIGIGDSCIFFYGSILKAEIASPVIEVDDHDFGTRPINTQTLRQQLHVQNSGKVDLVLTGDDHLTALAGTPFVAKDWDVNYPIVIQSGKSLSLDVEFAPKTQGIFTANIHFFSDSKKTDSICVLKGISIITDVEEAEENSQSIQSKLTPQPIRENAVLELSMPTSQRVTITVIDILGQKITTIAEDMMLESGVHAFPISTTGYSNGNYSIEIRPTVGDVVIQKMTVVR